MPECPSEYEVLQPSTTGFDPARLVNVALVIDGTVVGEGFPAVSCAYPPILYVPGEAKPPTFVKVTAVPLFAKADQPLFMLPLFVQSTPYCI